MKYTKLSTTSKIYLLTLLLIFSILLLDQRVFAQSSNKPTASQTRLDLMEQYLAWIDKGEYGDFSDDIGKKALAGFKSHLQFSLNHGKSCINPVTSQETFFGRINTFLKSITGQSKTNLQDEAAFKLSECKKTIKQNYKQAKKYNRLLKYLSIEEEKPNLCVKADLGVGIALKARGFNPKKPDLTGPLQVYLCTGQDGKKKVRVIDDSGTKLRLSEEDLKRNELKIENLPPKGSFEALLEKIGEKL